jgi:arylsulfatase A-like enzyme
MSNTGTRPRLAHGLIPALCLAIGPFATRTACAADAAGQNHVNVIIIFADDLGYGDLACYGHPTFQTPNLDRLADQGVRMTNFYVSCPYCAPSRVSLQTGRYQVRSGLVRNPCPDRGVNDIGIPPEEVTLGEAFQAAGYRTCCIGKWHLGHRPPFYPTQNGYHEYLGILYSNDMRPVQLIDGQDVVEYPVVQATLTKRYTKRAVDFIRRNRNRPFFLYFPEAMPHKPLAASEDFYKKTDTGLYGDVIRELDWSVGQIIYWLRKLDLDRRTLVFFTSDNGPWYGGSTGGLRGMKGRTWEGGIRVPMIAWWPGVLPAGKVCDEPAITLDLFTTSLRAAGLAPPSDRILDGKDILPLLKGEAKSPHEALFSFLGKNLKTVRSGKWKLHLELPERPNMKVWKPGEPWTDPRAPDGVTIIAPFEQAHPSEYPGLLTGDPVKKGELLLFDLDADPGEQHNVAGQHPDVVKNLKRMADDFRATLKS